MINFLQSNYVLVIFIVLTIASIYTQRKRNKENNQSEIRYIKAKVINFFIDEHSDYTFPKDAQDRFISVVSSYFEKLDYAQERKRILSESSTFLNGKTQEEIEDNINGSIYLDAITYFKDVLKDSPEYFKKND